MKYLLYLFGVILIVGSSCGNGTKHENSLILTDQNNTDTITIEDVALLKRIASIRNDVIKVGRMELDEMTLANQKKVVGIIGELLDRAEQKILGELPKGRYPWSWGGFDEPVGMVDMAEGFLEVLARGKDPFEGKYAEPGGYTVDHAIIKKDNLWHTEKPVLETIAEGFDSYQVWAPHIIEHQDKYWIFYTGVSDSATQAICLATSDDLYHWERHEANPLFNSLPWGYWDEDGSVSVQDSDLK